MQRFRCARNSQLTSCARQILGSGLEYIFSSARKLWEGSKLLQLFCLLKMVQIIPIGYIICLSLILILNVFLIYQDMKTDRRWEKGFAVFFGFLQTFVVMVIVTILTITLTSQQRFDWLDLAITCTLQLIVCTNVRLTIKITSLTNLRRLLAFFGF